ncbi:hypothetical protein EV356DRAFT_502260, partial [Viridothelium virens]
MGDFRASLITPYYRPAMLVLGELAILGCTDPAAAASRGKNVVRESGNWVLFIIAFVWGIPPPAAFFCRFSQAPFVGARPPASGFPFFLLAFRGVARRLRTVALVTTKGSHASNLRSSATVTIERPDVPVGLASSASARL